MRRGTRTRGLTAFNSNPVTMVVSAVNVPHVIIIIIIIIITDEYDLGGTVALLLQDHLTMLIVSHVTTNQSTTA